MACKLSGAIFKVKDKKVPVHKTEKYKPEKKEISYKQKEASDKGNKHTNNLYRTKIYNVSSCI